MPTYTIHQINAACEAADLDLDISDREMLEAYCEVFAYFDHHTETQESNLAANIADYWRAAQYNFSGTYQSPSDFAEAYAYDVIGMGSLPNFVVIDWQATWEHNLRHDFTFSSGHVFSNH